jgi:hypothetical protein
VSLFALVLAFALPTGVVEAVRIDEIGLRPAVTVVTRGGSGPVGVRREGREVVLTVGASLPVGLRLPKEVPPLEGLSAVQEGGATALRLTVPESVPFHFLRTETTISVVLGTVESTSAPPIGEKRSAKELYPLIFPMPGSDEPAEQPGATASEGGIDRRDDEREGFYLGIIRLRPSVLINYVDAATTLLATPQPVAQNYFEVQPRLGLGLGMGTEFAFFGSTLEIQYEPRFRTGVSLEALRKPTHMFFARLTVPVGSAIKLRASHQYSKGFLETTQVDPGREYFFDLGNFTRNFTEVGARVETGSPLSLDVAADRDVVDIEDTAGFFDHRTERFRVTPTLAMRADLRATLTLSTERVPLPIRHPEAEAHTRRATLGLEGELLPLVQGYAHAGLEDYRAPRAGVGGTDRRGFVGDLQLQKEFTPSSKLTLYGQRSTHVSFFEDNGFYVASRLEANQTLGLPFYLSLHLAVAQHWNRYRTVATGLT